MDAEFFKEALLSRGTIRDDGTGLAIDSCNVSSIFGTDRGFGGDELFGESEKDTDNYDRLECLSEKLCGRKETNHVKKEWEGVELNRQCSQ